MFIHPTAMVDTSSEIADTAEIGPYAYIGPGCKISDGVKVGIRAIIECNTTIGENTVISPNAHVAGAPQDLGYKGEDTFVEIGKNCVIREFSTIHRATTKENLVTRIGDNCYIMASAHVAHDCVLGNEVIMASYSALSGHVHVGDYTFISGFVGVHQFARIGTMVMVAGMSRISKDVPSYCTVFSNSLEGLNVVGLRRRGVKAEARAELKKALAILQDKSCTFEEAKEKMKELEEYPEVLNFRDFLENSKRGIIRN
jgi:UDP-N-acetylglucosamine acyltransferase